MTDIDLLVRDTLNHHAEDAPSAGALLAGVHNRSRRLRRRRRVAVAGAGMSMVLVAFGAVPSVLDAVGPDRRPGTGGVGASPTLPAAPTAPATDEPSTAPDRSAAQKPAPLILGKAAYRLPSFPYTPQYRPRGFAAGSAFMAAGEVYLRQVGSPPDLPYIEVRLSPQRSRPAQPGDRPVTVRQTTGVYGVDTTDGITRHYLYWMDTSGRWVHALSERITAEELIRYANGLTRGDVQLVPPFGFELLPQGLVLDEIGPGNMIFRRPDSPAGGDWSDKLAVLLGDSPMGEPQSSEWPLRAGDRPARIHQQDPGRSLEVAVGNRRYLVIQVPGNMVISDADLLAIAAGIKVNGTARAASG